MIVNVNDKRKILIDHSCYNNNRMNFYFLTIFYSHAEVGVRKIFIILVRLMRY